VGARWLALLVMPVACLDPVGPAFEPPSAQPEPSDSPVTITTVGNYRYLVHWDAKPRPCPTESLKTFPIDSLQARDGWYGGQLRAAGEGPLCSDASPARELYRLAWIPSFHHTVIVRIERRGGEYSLTTVQCRELAGTSPERRWAVARSQSANQSGTSGWVWSLERASGKLGRLPLTQFSTRLGRMSNSWGSTGHNGCSKRHALTNITQSIAGRR